MTNLPALTGSAKQIEWAASIRNNLVVAIEHHAARETLAEHVAFLLRGANQAVSDELAAFVAKHVSSAVERADADFWIDNRNVFIGERRGLGDRVLNGQEMARQLVGLLTIRLNADSIARNQECPLYHDWFFDMAEQ